MARDDERIKALSEKAAEKLLGQDIFIKRAKEIFDECVGTVDFMEKIRKYASMEFDSRLFTSGKYWGAIILTAIITSAIGFVIASIFNAFGG